MNDSQEPNRNNSIVPQRYFTRNNLFSYQEQTLVEQINDPFAPSTLKIHVIRSHLSKVRENIPSFDRNGTVLYIALLSWMHPKTLETLKSLESLELLQQFMAKNNYYSYSYQEKVIAGGLNAILQKPYFFDLISVSQELLAAHERSTLGEVAKLENTDPVDEILGDVNNQYQEDTTLLQQPIGEVAKLENTDNIDVGGVAACTIL